MGSKKILLFILISSIILRLSLIYLNQFNPNFSFEQEGYTFYINSLKDGTLSTPGENTYDKRLFPGYLLIILPFTYIFNNPIAIGIILNLIVFVISFYLVWKIFNKILINLIFAFFPPIWLIQTAKASSEPLTIMLLLSSLYLTLKKYYFLAGIILGLAFSVRIIAGCLLIALIISLFIQRKFSDSSKIIIGFLFSASLLLLYNYLIFGSSNLLLQFVNLDQNYGTVRIGIIQIFQDIFRTIDWGQYRILFSGMFYLLLSFITVLTLFIFRKKSSLHFICFLWSLFSLIFVFSLTPFTLIENFSRYFLPALPTTCLAIYEVLLVINKRLDFMPELPKLSPNKKRMKTH